MNLNEYQDRAMSTCMDSSNNYVYMAEGMVSEVGEFMGKIAKGIRKEHIRIASNHLNYNTKKMNFDEFKAFDKELQKELGDVLWFVAGMCFVMGWSLEDVAQLNLDKLASRQERGVIDGNGDNR